MSPALLGPGVEHGDVPVPITCHHGLSVVRHRFDARDALCRFLLRVRVVLYITSKEAQVVIIRRTARAFPGIDRLVDLIIIVWVLLH